jgi:hypothetical protein
MAAAPRTARAGLGNRTKKPSPVVFASRPPGADDRLDVLGPPPAWLEDGAPDGQLAQLDQLDASLLDTPDLVGMVEALATQLHRTDRTN